MTRVALQTQRVYRLERPARRRHPLRRLHRLWRRFRSQQQARDNRTAVTARRREQGLVAALGTAAVLGAVIAGPVFAQPGDGCAPVETGWDGIFVQPVEDACTGSEFIRAEDVHDLTTAGQTPDGYVLVSDMRRDDNGKEALILVKPWSFDRYTLGLTLTRVFRDGSVDGTTWHEVAPAGDPALAQHG